MARAVTASRAEWAAMPIWWISTLSAWVIRAWLTPTTSRQRALAIRRTSRIRIDSTKAICRAFSRRSRQDSTSPRTAIKAAKAASRTSRRWVWSKRPSSGTSRDIIGPSRSRPGVRTRPSSGTSSSRPIPSNTAPSATSAAAAAARQRAKARKARTKATRPASGSSRGPGAALIPRPA